MFHTHPCSTKHVENIPFLVEKKTRSWAKIGLGGIRTSGVTWQTLLDHLDNSMAVASVF